MSIVITIGISDADGCHARELHVGLQVRAQFLSTDRVVA
jgi:hypothetical protein